MKTESPFEMNTGRMRRIKHLSRFLKGLLLANAVAVTGLFAYGRAMGRLGLNVAPPLLQSPKEDLYYGFCCALLLTGIIAIYRLLNLYEKGVVFAAENAAHIRRMGFVMAIYGLLQACASLLLPYHGVFSVSATLLNFLLSPWFFAGCFAIIASWIMDEGRQIQEEQQLTV
jgi:hypothetical protein